MKRLYFFLWIILILGLATGCGSTDAPDVTQEANIPYQFHSGELEKYTIVYSERNPEYRRLANQLADRILEKYDIFITTASDTDTSPAQHEILLGDTNRTAPSGEIMAYSVTVDTGRFHIQAGGAFSAQEAVTTLCQQLFNGQAFSLEPGEYYKTSFLTKIQAVTEGTSARIMSANVLADAFADSAYQTAHYRAEIFAGMLISYTPDILGLQETDENWNSVLDEYLEKIHQQYSIDYARHLTTYQDKINYTSLLYRCDKFQVADSGVDVFSWWSDSAFNHSYHMRNISWAKFSAIENPAETFITANTHWSYRTEHAGGNTFLAGSDTPIAENELRLQCKDETDAFLTVLAQSNPDVPIIVTGDFNTSLTFFTESNWTPAGFQLISQAATETGKAISLVPASGHFDHLFGSGTYTIHLFGFFNDSNQHNLLTDHPFVYADFTF